MAKHIQVPLDAETARSLKAGEEVLLSGVLYTGRDAAHKRMMQCRDTGAPLPFDMEGQVIYYVGPCPAPPGKVIGSAGPTTSGRMDAYAPRLLDLGLKGMIGKGLRNQAVKDAIVRNGAVYFGAVGGAAALIARSVMEETVIAFADLGTEAVRRLVVRDFPAFVVIDAAGNDLYETGRAQAAALLADEAAMPTEMAAGTVRKETT